MNKVLEGKVAVITGGTQGLGFAIAEEFAAEGAEVVITGRHQDTIDEALDRLDPRCWGFRADVSVLADMESLYRAVSDRHGRVDIIVANAITNDNGPLGTITEEQFDKIINTNMKGVLWTVQPALPLMPSGSSVVLIGSTASISPPPGMSVYGGAKAGVRSMVRAWIQDIKGSGIRINVLCSGAIDTPSLRSALAGASGESEVDAAVEKMGSGNPIGRLAQPRELATVAVFLASDASSFITGTELFADGGMVQV